MIESADTEGHVNPFKEYQKRRNGKVGQRFHGAIVEIDTQQSLYDGELMLAGWADTEKGKTVKFWIDEEASTHPFAGCKKRTGSDVGTFMMGVLVLLNCDQQPLAEEIESRGRSLSSQIHLMITGPLFVAFMTERSQRTEFLHSKGLRWDSMYKGEMMTKAYVKSFLKIESLSVLDHDKEKAELFHKVFREKFARWSGAKGK